MSAPKVLGLDLSLTATGVALPDGETTTITIGRGATGMLRLSMLVHAVMLRANPDFDAPGLVAVEGYAYGRANQAHQMGELGGCVRLALFHAGVPFVEVAPTQVKKYATGRGNAKKDEVLVAAVRRLGYEGASHDEADALWLRALVLDALGEPVVTVPAGHREALAKVTLPAPFAPLGAAGSVGEGATG